MIISDNVKQQVLEVRVIRETCGFDFLDRMIVSDSVIQCDYCLNLLIIVSPSLFNFFLKL